MRHDPIIDPTEALYPYLSEYRKLQVRQALTGLRNPPNFR